MEQVTATIDIGAASVEAVAADADRDALARVRIPPRVAPGRVR